MLFIVYVERNLFCIEYIKIFACYTATTMQTSISPHFQLFTLPPAPYPGDIVWNITVHIRDVYWATTVVLLLPTIG